MARGFLALYDQMRPLIGERGCMVGAGNGLRRNRLLAQILASTFGMSLHIALQEEAAATGAALLAAVGAGEIPDLAAAGELLRYADAVPPAFHYG